MLHAMRRRMHDMAEAEAAGENFWTEGFDSRVRQRVRLAYDRIAQAHGFAADERIFARARHMILEQLGLRYLAREGWVPYGDFDAFLREAADDFYPTAIEALLTAVAEWATTESEANAYSQLARDTGEIFAQERVAWKLVDGQMVEMKSSELHEAVVEPALRLLHDARYTAVDASYRKALDELSRGDGADAVTDAGTALQELLTALGCQGNQLGDLIRSARAKGLLAGHDTPLLQAVEKALHWVAADRSVTGESHHASDASRDDAWLIVHIVGAFIVRLAAGSQRTSQ